MAELYTERLIGWRCWKVRSDGDVLSALFMSYDWPVDTAVADHLVQKFAMFGGGGKGRPDPHDAPASGHPCGLHGYGTLEGAFDGQKSGSRPDHAFVFGAVAAWGRIIVHETGFRAQYAKVLCLVEEADPKLTNPTPTGPQLTRDGWVARARKVADRYGVPLLPPELAVEYVASEGAAFSEFSVEAT